MGGIERAEYAAIARTRTKQGLAAGAFIVELTGVSRHRLALYEAALRAGEYRFGNGAYAFSRLTMSSQMPALQRDQRPNCLYHAERPSALQEPVY